MLHDSTIMLSPSAPDPPPSLPWLAELPAFPVPPRHPCVLTALPPPKGRLAPRRAGASTRCSSTPPSRRCSARPPPRPSRWGRSASSPSTPPRSPGQRGRARNGPGERSLVGLPPAGSVQAPEKVAHPPPCARGSKLQSVGVGVLFQVEPWFGGRLLPKENFIRFFGDHPPNFIFLIKYLPSQAQRSMSPCVA